MSTNVSLSSQEERQRNTKAMAAAEKELPEMSLGGALGAVIGGGSMGLDINIEKLQYAEMMSQVEEDTKDFIMDVSPISTNHKK